MSDVVADIANAVLYEGHMLWPYRPSATKNRQRWTFGGVYPPAYARETSDRSRVFCECLADGDAPRFDVEVRFLEVGDEVVERRVGIGEIEHPPGRVEAQVEELRPGLHRLSVAVENTSAWAGSDRNEAMRHTHASAHAVLSVEGGAFLSSLDPPVPLREDGLWPVLVGEEGDRSMVLASPIILPDYPRVAPESPGDFFDGCEIDQLLVLNILALTDEEKSEIRAGDPRARALLERTEAMAPADLMRLHGTWREP
jgi:hypothetical protein